MHLSTHVHTADAPVAGALVVVEAGAGHVVGPTAMSTKKKDQALLFMYTICIYPTSYEHEFLYIYITKRERPSSDM